ncbi:hypothetical protein PSM36_2509 [Proteiniphilum saccharofermentans]|uniref:Uncharacterized protein n=1 Tax=Proteiniphilum saccharofermentans TaxID=1642647 RepID=A0A1R3T2G7_9BACT|nr:hypothetical protein [Proteiniphilum saccharofermentans]SCD21310.1 hypothetical protein PSM36_2509 [Proteiniphilum saccharofermentans]
MRDVIVSDTVVNKISELRDYLAIELKMSENAAMSRVDRIGDFLKSLANLVEYPLCRFKKWRSLGYRCAVFEKDWIFAYELVKEGVIVQDMSNTALLAE